MSTAPAGRPAGKGETVPKDGGGGVRTAAARSRATARARRVAARRAVRARLVPDRRQRIPVAAVVAAAWALGVGLLVCIVVAVVGWTVGGHGTATFASAVRSGALGFVAAHMAPVSLPGTMFSLLPLGLLALPALLTYRAGRWAARAADCRSLRDVGRLTGTAAGTYAVLTLLVSTLGVVGPAQVPAAAAVLAAALVSALGIGLGALSSSRLWPVLRAQVPSPVRRGIRAGALVLAALGVASGVVVTLALALHVSAVATLTEQIAPGAAASAVLLVLCLLYLPTILVWALSYLVGTGFLLGGATITPFGGGGGLVPAFPLLGAVPDQPPRLAPLLLLVPVLAGVLGGVALLRTTRGGDGRLPGVEILTATGVTALTATVLGFVGSGSLGEGRLAHVGPSVWAMPLALTGLVLLGLAPTAVLGTLLTRPSTQRPAPVDLREQPEPVPAPGPVVAGPSPVAAGLSPVVTGPAAPRAFWLGPAPSEPALAPSEPALAPSEPALAPSEPAHAPSEPAPEQVGDAAPGGVRALLHRCWGKVRPLLHADGTATPVDVPDSAHVSELAAAREGGGADAEAPVPPR